MPQRESLDLGIEIRLRSALSRARATFPARRDGITLAVIEAPAGRLDREDVVHAPIPLSLTGRVERTDGTDTLTAVGSWPVGSLAGTVTDALDGLRAEKDRGLPLRYAGSRSSKQSAASVASVRNDGPVPSRLEG